MPSTVYLSSADEFVVAESYGDVLHLIEAGNPSIELTYVRWTDPEREGFDDLDRDIWPALTETPLSIRTSAIIAVNRVADCVTESIDRARRHERDR